MTWTKKHDEFALACQFRESMSLILRFCFRRAKLTEPTEIELDLKKCNAWIGKHRVKGEYHRKTLATAIALLDERSRGVFTILRSYSPWVHKVLIRPLDFAQKIEDAKCAHEPKPPTPKPMFDADHKARLDKQQQQDISNLHSILSKVGLIYSRDALLRIWRLAGRKIESVRKAIELMLYQNSTQSEPIRKASGWLVSCLKNNWQENFDSYYQPELPKFASISDIETFTRSCFS